MDTTDHQAGLWVGILRGPHGSALHAGWMSVFASQYDLGRGVSTWMARVVAMAIRQRPLELHDRHMAPAVFAY